VINCITESLVPIHAAASERAAIQKKTAAIVLWLREHASLPVDELIALPSTLGR
jgi:hypothetical protein